MQRKNKITWTEIAIQLVGEVPASCMMDHHGQMWIRKASGARIIFEKKEVNAAIRDLEGIAAAAAEAKAPVRQRHNNTRRRSTLSDSQPIGYCSSAPPPIAALINQVTSACEAL